MLIIFVLICFVFSNEFVRFTVTNYQKRNAMCNDLSPSIYYVRTTSSKDKWLIYLEGGGGCYDKSSCDERWKNYNRLMTSKDESVSWKLDGIGSTNCTKNPAFCDYNQAFIHYCSSDWWSGNHNDSSTIGYSFLGKEIVRSVVEDLIELHGLDDASKVVLTGASAGGVGTFANSDFVVDILKQGMKKEFKYSILSDSGWFLDGKGFEKYECVNNEYCWYQKRMITGNPMWEMIPHQKCGESFSEEEKWKCLVGKHVYPFIEARKFAIFNIFDFWQAMQDFGRTVLHISEFSKKEKKWVFGRGNETYQSIIDDKMEQDGVMALGCYDHGTIPFTSYYEVKNLKGEYIKDVIFEWEKGGSPFSVDECKDIPCNKFCRRQ